MALGMHLRSLPERRTLPFQLSLAQPRQPSSSHQLANPFPNDCNNYSVCQRFYVKIANAVRGYLVLALFLNFSCLTMTQL